MKPPTKLHFRAQSARSLHSFFRSQGFLALSAPTFSISWWSQQYLSIAIGLCWLLIRSLEQGLHSLFLERALSCANPLLIHTVHVQTASPNEGHWINQVSEPFCLPFNFHTTVGKAPITRGLKAIFHLVYQTFQAFSDHRTIMGLHGLTWGASLSGWQFHGS